MKKEFIMWLFVAILSSALTFTFFRINSLQNENWKMQETINSLNSEKKLKKLSSEIEELRSDLESRLDNLEYSDLEERVDDLESDIADLQRYSHSHY